MDWLQVYDDLDTVLHCKQAISHHAAGPSDGAPVRSCDDAEERIQRFHGALKLLVALALRDNADERHPDVASLIERARALRAEEMPGDPRQALGLLRRLAQVTLALAERLAEVDTVKGLFEC
ncbi:DUF6415 family natural product biosynthesis protein [Streptomyces violascens]|uniref:DUF6415 family natural product biosynthesis protein n=1 Tax=Streptomyces violascens TaxID=67381 RepID=UPI0037AC5BA2